MKPDEIERIKKRAVGTPLEYILTPDAPLVDTPLGQVQIGSFLSYQVSISSTVYTNNIKSMSICLIE